MTERRYSLLQACPDSWFDNVSASSPDFERLFEMIGSSTVALAMVAGVQITSVSYDSASIENTMIGFSFGEEPVEQELQLDEFRQRIGASLLSGSGSSVDVEEQPTEAELQKRIGIRNVLLAPVFGMPLQELVVDSNRGDVVVFRTETGLEEMELSAFQEQIANRIRQELSLTSASNGPSIDLSLVPRARSANEANDYRTTTTLIGPWINSIFVLIRTGQMNGLESEVHDAITEALALLGTAYCKLSELVMADEVFRLGVQWADETEFASDMYFLLGETCVERQAWGEAIGPLRRAVRLGGDELRILPDLARCFIERKQYIAAMACIERTRSSEAGLGALEALLPMIPSEVRAGWDTFTGFLKEKAI